MSNTPTMVQAETMERILLTTDFIKGGYVAQCVTDNRSLVTEPKAAPYMAINHLINAVVKLKNEKGLRRNFDYIFTTKL